eukprot:1439727-Pleurochrysis_carterae.AAC.2
MSQYGRPRRQWFHNGISGKCAKKFKQVLKAKQEQALKASTATALGCGTRKRLEHMCGSLICKSKLQIRKAFSESFSQRGISH